jgi:hypothetical protein
MSIVLAIDRLLRYGPMTPLAGTYRRQPMLEHQRMTSMWVRQSPIQNVLCGDSDRLILCPQQRISVIASKLLSIFYDINARSSLGTRQVALRRPARSCDNDYRRPVVEGVLTSDVEDVVGSAARSD